MSKYVCFIPGARGRSIEVYDNKCIIRTSVTAGSVLTGNATDGRKTIFYTDCVGIQLKESGALIGYLQLETPCVQMNNQNSNFFSENTFTFEEKNEVNNALILMLYEYIAKRIEGYKYGFEEGESYEPPEELLNYDNSISNKAIFFCPKCKVTYGASVGTSATCPECKVELRETTVLSARWRMLTATEKEAYRKSWDAQG